MITAAPIAFALNVLNKINTKQNISFLTFLSPLDKYNNDSNVIHVAARTVGYE